MSWHPRLNILLRPCKILPRFLPGKSCKTLQALAQDLQGSWRNFLKILDLLAKILSWTWQHCFMAVHEKTHKYIILFKQSILSSKEGHIVWNGKTLGTSKRRIIVSSQCKMCVLDVLKFEGITAYKPKTYLEGEWLWSGLLDKNWFASLDWTDAIVFFWKLLFNGWF